MNNSLRILLADDDKDDRKFFKDAIESAKIQPLLSIVNDGAELMDYLRDKNNILPDLIFLDLNMPKKDGLECLKEIRADAKLKHISVAIYSTSGSEKDMEDTFVLGANIYIKKPNDFKTLKKALTSVISINWQYHTSGLNKDNFLLRI
jgi:CheY-like chemotaxis protein